MIFHHCVAGEHKEFCNSLLECKEKFEKYVNVQTNVLAVDGEILFSMDGHKMAGYATLKEKKSNHINIEKIFKTEKLHAEEKFLINKLTTIMLRN